MKYGNDLSLEETTGEYVGCATFGCGFVDLFRESREQLISSHQHSMAADRPIIAQDFAGAFWGEVDCIKDYERIMEHYGRQGTAHE
jgi:choline kinase